MPADRLLASAEAPHIRLFLAVALRLGRRFNGRRSTSKLGNKGPAVVPINDDLLPALIEAKAGATACGLVIEHGGNPVGSVKTGTRAAARRAGLPWGYPAHLPPHGRDLDGAGGGAEVQIARFLARDHEASANSAPE